MTFLRLPTKGDIKEVIVRSQDIILVTPMPLGTVRVHLDPAVHEVTDFVADLTMNEISALLTKVSQA